jgi:pimeloyl-ACP methyl ester carboxylesterase
MTPEQFQSALDHSSQGHETVVAGAAVRYRRWQKIGAPGVLLVHGHAAHSQWWDHIGPALHDRFDVTAIDLTGAGDSDHRDYYTPALFAAELVAVSQSVGYQSPIIVGHSFGGTLSRIACWLYPNWAGQLILVDSVIAPPKRSSDAKGKDPIKPVSAKRPPKPPRYYDSLEKAVTRFRLRPRQPSRHPHIVAHIAARSIRKTPRGYTYKLDRGLFDKLLTNVTLPPAATMLAELAIPKSAIIGDLSYFFDTSTELGRDNRAQLYQLLPDAHIQVIPEAFHHVPLDQPLAFIDALWRAFGSRAHNLDAGDR